MIKKLKDCVVTNKNVFLRADLNVPMKNGKIIDDTRIHAVIPTIKYLMENKAKVILASHFGRPKGKFMEEMSLKPIGERIGEILGHKIGFVGDCIGDMVQEAVFKTNYGEVILLENLRFYDEEEKNDEEFSRKLASLAHLYVNDAFSCSHRAHASITGIAKILKSCCGFLMEKELENLMTLVENPKKPLMVIIAGSKISTKIDLLRNLANKADILVVGGAMANTFIKAKGCNIGKSMYEPEMIENAREIMNFLGDKLVIPQEVVICDNIENPTKIANVNIENVGNEDIIADISVEFMGSLLAKCKSVIWNGPVGAFEYKPFDNGSIELARIIAEFTRNGGISIAGGGDVVAAINKAGKFDDFTYISTAGGAFLEYCEGKILPGIEVLLK